MLTSMQLNASVPKVASFVERWELEISRLPNAANFCAEEMVVKAGEEISFYLNNQFGGYIVSKGHFQLNLTEGKETRAIRICSPDSLIGYGGWLLSNTRNYSLLALNDCRVKFYTEAMLRVMQAQSLKINELIIESLCAIILVKDERIYALEQISAPTRVKYLLYSLAAKFGVSDVCGKLIEIGISRKTLAQLAAVTPESFSRILTELEDEGALTRRRRSIIISNPENLRKIS